MTKHSKTTTKKKTTKVVKKKATAKKAVAKPKTSNSKSKAQSKTQPKKAAAKAKGNGKPAGACARIREIADGMPDAEPSEVYAKCEAAGIHPRTTRAEYSNWSKAKFGKSPSERFGSVRRGFQKGEGGGAAIDDSKVKVVTSSKLSDGWKTSQVDIGGRHEDMITDPFGVQYVRAQGNERADIIVHHSKTLGKALGKSRWRRLETSSKGRDVKTTQEEKKGRKDAPAKRPSKRTVKRKVGLAQ